MVENTSQNEEKLHWRQQEMSITFRNFAKMSLNLLMASLFRNTDIVDKVDNNEMQ